MKRKKKDKDPNNLRVRRGDLRAQLRDNLVIETVNQHQPWTYVDFTTTYRDPSTNENMKITGWGVSKICWPDKWNDEYGVELAIERGLAWAVKELIPPLEYDINPTMLKAGEEALLRAQRRAAESLYVSN